MKQAYDHLPGEYVLAKTVDVSEQRGLTWGINIFSLLFFVAAVLPVHLLYLPMYTLAYVEGVYNLPVVVIRLCLLIVCVILLMYLQMMIQYVLIWLFGKKRPQINFHTKGLFSSVSRPDNYYSRPQYLLFTLLPIVVMAVPLGILCFFVPDEWFWFVYFLAILSVGALLSGLLLSFLCLRMPRGVLVIEAGVCTRFYVRNTAKAPASQE